MKKCKLCNCELKEGQFVCEECGSVDSEAAIAVFGNDLEASKTLKDYYAWELRNVIVKRINKLCVIAAMITLIIFVVSALATQWFYINRQAVIIISSVIVAMGVTTWFCHRMALEYWKDLVDIQNEYKHQ